MAKVRSPHYPSLTLEEAWEKVRAVYAKEFTNPAPREVIAKDLGYNALHGASLGVIATLLRYGLLEKVAEEGLRVSADAVSILELDGGHPERFEALKRLAFQPKLFAELQQKYPKDQPSAINLKHYLIQQKKFLPKAAEEVIRIYRENLELVTEQGEPYDGGESGKSGEKPPMQHIEKVKSAETATAHREPGGGLRLETTASSYEFSFPLSLQRDIKATITISGSSELKRRDLEFLKRKVGDLLEGFDDEEAPNILRFATWKNKDHDQPVTVTRELGEGPDGRRYFKIMESDTGVPEDELEFNNGGN